jgi:hypothetical protein
MLERVTTTIPVEGRSDSKDPSSGPPPLALDLNQSRGSRVLIDWREVVHGA